MTTHILHASLAIPRALDQVFPFFADAANLGRITPPELHFRMRTPAPIAMHTGTVIEYTIGLYGMPMRWRSLISRWDPPHGFVDEQQIGPYALWHHEHRFTALGPAETLVEDVVTYRLPLAPLGELAHPLVRRQLTRIFAYRQKTVCQLLVPEAGPMKSELSIR